MARERSAGAVVFRKDGKNIFYLILGHKFKTEYWDFPKGNIETNESEEETIRREIKEETGIDDIIIIDGFKEKVNYFYRREGETIFKEVVYFLAKTKTKEVKISYEHTSFGWFGFETAKNMLKESSRKVLVKANSFLTGKLARYL